MTDETAALTATLKFGGGYADPWLVVRADTAEELVGLLQQAAQAGAVATLAQSAVEAQAVYTAARSLGAKPVAVEAAPQAAPPTPPWQPPQQAAPTSPAPSAPAAPAPAAAPAGAPTCQHGPMVWRTGVSKKTGQPWQAWMCSAPRGATDKCDAQFVR